MQALLVISHATYTQWYFEQTRILSLLFLLAVKYIAPRPSSPALSEGINSNYRDSKFIKSLTHSITLSILQRTK